MKTTYLYFVMLFTSVFSISNSLSAKISFTIDKTFTKDTIIEIPQNLLNLFHLPSGNYILKLGNYTTKFNISK